MCMCVCVYVHFIIIVVIIIIPARLQNLNRQEKYTRYVRLRAPEEKINFISISVKSHAVNYVSVLFFRPNKPFLTIPEIFKRAASFFFLRLLRVNIHSRRLLQMVDNQSGNLVFDI